ncbi:hypothetical protein H8A95_15985 [Bradyrhizobium sp. Pear76]|uniref:hypothetical protein n=1 Tax=Bradyrhizobium oropedii TaxID=1571201 RepID=UPI001E631FA9|nr:hypothetical protein [Bradyrhizobium oropedii]MCC8963771.1 hypothetical protein [Bradyrhizobium oropedii]
MNLHGIVAPVIGAVNPNYPVLFEASTGFTQAADFSQQPSFGAGVSVMAQVQELSTPDVQELDALNLQKSGVAIYLYGVSNGIVRVNNKGGDRITVHPGVPQAGVYIVQLVLEQWPDWVKVSAILQNQAAS